jgi:hypothetical protein
MKKLLILYSILFLSAFNVQSQAWELGKNSVKVDVLQFIFSGNIEMDYERYWSNGSSIIISGGYTFRGLSAQIRRYDRWGANAEIQYRKFILPFQLNDKFRVYMGPFIRYKFLEYTRDEIVTESVVDNNGNWSSVEIKYNSIDQFSSYYTGFVFGFSSYLGKHVELDMFIGAGVKINGRVLYPDEYGFLQTKSFGMAVNPGFSGVLPRFGIRLGGLF